jgi:YVTN family beta-propeller protein
MCAGSVIDTNTNNTVKEIGVGLNPLGVAITPDGHFVYVANRQPLNITAVGNVSVIDIGTNAVVATVGVGENPTGVAVGSISGTCSGDCNNNGVVTVEELLLGVNIALGTAPLSECLSLDANHDGVVTVDELLAAVNTALNGCADA